jgi:hypothetical protein
MSAEVKLQEYATREQIEFFDRLRSGDDPEHEEARTELVALANAVVDIMTFGASAAAMQTAARAVLDGHKVYLGDRIWAKDDEVGDTNLRLTVYGDTGAGEFYFVLETLAKLLTLAGRGDMVVPDDDEARQAEYRAAHPDRYKNPRFPTTEQHKAANEAAQDAVAAHGTGAAYQSVMNILVEKKGEPTAQSIETAVRLIEKDVTKQIALLMVAAGHAA